MLAENFANNLLDRAFPFIFPPMITIRKTSDLLDGFDRAVAWFRARGVDLTQGRFAQYRNTLIDANNAKDQRDSVLNWPAARMAEVFATAAEVFDLLEIVQLNDEVLEGNRQKLRDIATGPRFYSELQPQDQDQGRDSAFELLTAVGMQRAGGTPSLDDPTDVRVEWDQSIALIECKRPKTDDGYMRLVTRGFRQFANHRARGCAGAGIIAVDITMLMNPHLKILPARNRTEAMDALHHHAKGKHDHLLTLLMPEQLAENAGVDAILVRATAVTINQGEERPEVATALQVYPTDANQGSDSHLQARAFANLYHRAGAGRPQ